MTYVHYSLRLKCCLMVVFCTLVLICNNSAATTHEEFLRKVPDYTSHLAENSEERSKAIDLLRIFAPFILRGEQLFMQLMDANSAIQWLEKTCRWVVDNSSLSHEEIFSYIMRESQRSDSNVPFQQALLVFSNPLPYGDTHQIGSLLLKRLSAFSLDPNSGQYRFTLVDERAFQAQIYYLYNKRKIIYSTSWVFQTLRSNIVPILKAIGLKGVPEENLELLQKQRDYSDSDSFRHTITYKDFIIVLDYDIVDDTWMLKLSVLNFDEEKKTNRLNFVLKFIFVDKISDSSFLFFEPDGYFPVQDIQPMVETMHHEINANDKSAAKGRRLNFLILKKFEQQFHKLTSRPDLLYLLESLNLEDEKSITLTDIQAVIPEPFEEILGFPKTDRKTLNNKLKDRKNWTETKQKYIESRSYVRKKVSERDHSLGDFGDFTRFNLFDETKRVAENLKKVSKKVVALWEFQREIQNSYFLKYYEELWEKGDEEVKAQYHLLLFRAYKGWVRRLDQLVVYRPVGVTTPELLNLAAAKEVLSAELALGAEVQYSHLLVLKKVLSDDENSELKVNLGTLQRIKSSYNFLVKMYRFMEGNNDNIRDFRSYAPPWYRHLFYINKWIEYLKSIKAEMLSQEDFLHLTVLQFQIVGEVMDDIHSLAEFLPFSLAESTKYLDTIAKDETSIEEIKKQFNLSLQKVLLSHLWEIDSDQGADLLSRFSELLSNLERFPLGDHSHTAAFKNIRARWQVFDDKNKAKYEASAKKALQIGEELLAKENEANKARAKLFKHKKVVKKTLPKESKKQVIIPEPQFSSFIKHEKQWKEARHKAQQRDFNEAEKLYMKVLNTAPADSQSKAAVLVELADMSLQAVGIEVNKIVKLCKFIQDSRLWFQRKIDGITTGGKSKTNNISRESLFDNANELFELWKLIEPKLSDAYKKLLDARNALIKLPDNDEIDVDFNRQLVEANIKYISQQYQYVQIMLSEQLDVFELRAEWLRALRQREESRRVPEQTHRERKKDISTLIDDIKRAKESIEKQISQLWVNGQSTVIPVDYQPFEVSGDGNCFYSALAIALNQPNGRTDHWTAYSVRQKIHERLKGLIEFINRQPDNEELKAQLALLLGVSFDELTGLVSGEFLSSAPGATCNPDEVLMHYGEVNYALLLLLDQPLALGVQVSNSEDVFSYNYNFWLQHAPLLLSVLIQQGEVNIDHWPEAPELINHLQSDSHIPDTLLQQIEQQPLDAILVHSGSTGSLAQHFNVVVRRSPDTDRDLMKRMDGLTGIIAFVFVYHKSIGINSMRSH